MDDYSEEIEEDEISVQEMYFKNINKLHQTKEAHSKREKANYTQRNHFNLSEQIQQEYQKPIPFIVYQNRFETIQEAMDILESYQDKKIAFVSIFGKNKTGKTTLINNLLDFEKNRAAENSQQNANITKNYQSIQMWPKPQYNEKMDLYMFFLENEIQIESNSEKENRIGAFLLLISSFFIYNTTGKLDDNTLNDCQFLNLLNSYIPKNEYGETMQENMIQNYMPYLAWILRDYNETSMVESSSRGKGFINPNEQLNMYLLDQAGKTDNVNKIKNYFLSYFKDRELLTMNKPFSDDKNQQSNEINQEFSEQINSLRKLIIEKTQEKDFNKKKLNQRALMQIVNYFVNGMNQKDVPFNLHNAWQNILYNECIKAREECSFLLESEFKNRFLTSQKPLDFIELYQNIRSMRDTILEKYDQIAGIQEKNHYYTQFRLEIISLLEQKEQEAFLNNEEYSNQENDELIKTCGEKLRNKIYQQQYSHNNIKEYISDLDKFLEDYDKKAVGTKKAENLTQQLQQINDQFVKLLVNSIKSDFEEKNLKKDQNSISNFEKQENLYNLEIIKTDKKIQEITEKNNQLELEKKRLEEERDRRQRSLSQKKDESDNIQKNIGENQEQLEQQLKNKDKIIKDLKDQINNLKKTKSKGCFGI